MRMNRRTNLVLPEALVDEVDRIAGPRMRSAYIAEAVEARLRRDRLKQVVDRTRGVLSADDYPEWSTPEKVVAWVRARRADVTGPGEDRG
jgi:metal-responsive CopG/Arc/MetJ family transcriptional regulator